MYLKNFHGRTSRANGWSSVPGVMLFCVVLLYGVPALALPFELLLIGDSITEGCVSGPTGTDCTCDQGLCYAAGLSTYLGSDYQIVNAGVGGSTTADWASDAVGIPYVLVGDTPTPIFEGVAAPNLPADIVLIMLGANDAIGVFEPSPIAPDMYFENLDAMVTRILDLDAGRVVLVRPPPLLAFDETVQDRLRSYGTEIDRLCAFTMNVVCGPDLTSLLTPDDFEGDDLHPNAAGHDKIAWAVSETIVSIPEPSAAFLMGLGLAALGLRRRV
jgi:lysophospholipase L1-like esterase